MLNNSTNTTIDVNEYQELSEWGKLFIVLGVSIIFWIICLIIFHFFRKYRKDKLITNKFSMNYKDEIDTDDMYLHLNERGAKELVDQRISDANVRNNNSIYNHEKIKKLRKKTKDYSFFGWFKFIYNISDKEVMTIMNGEGYIYIYYQRITGHLFLFLSFISLFILIPFYLIGANTNDEIMKKFMNITLPNTTSTPYYNYTKTKEIPSILKPTIANAYSNPLKLWVILIFSLLYTCAAYYHLYTYVKKIIEIKKNDKHVDHSLEAIIRKHSIHIRGINQNLSYLEAKNIIENFFQTYFSSKLVGVELIANYDILDSLIEKKFIYQSFHEKYRQYNLSNYPERKELSSEGWFNCNKKKRDAEIYFQHLVNINEEMLKFYRQLNSKRNTGNAFILFKSPVTVDEILNHKEIIIGRMNSFEGTLLNVGNWIIKRAPTPSDILWDNIKYSKKWRTIRMVFFTLALFIGCLIIITPNYIFEELSPIISNVSSQIKDEMTSSLIKEYSYPLIVVIMNSGVIPVIVGYIAVAELHYKRSYREKSIFVKNVVFMVINCFIIPTFGVLSWPKLKECIKYLFVTHWDMDISEGFIRNSYFFLRYAIQVTFISNGIQLLSLPQFFVKKMRVFLASSDYEKFYASMIKKYFDYGYNYSFSITVFMLILCFSTHIPLITPFGALFFYIKYYIDKYNLLFLFPAEFESHGNVTEMIIKFELIGIFFFQFIISNIFIKIFRDKDYAIYATLLYILLSIFIFYGMKQLYLASENDLEEQNFLEKFMSKIKLNQILFNNNSFRIDKQASLVRDSSNVSYSGDDSDYNVEKLYISMINAYVHPAEKNQTVNPMQIWNDAYTYMKTNSVKMGKDKDRIYREYTDIIKPLNDTSNHDHN
jgi:hypothetical protein